MRAKDHSPNVIHNSMPGKRWAIQPAMPVWSMWKCVQMTRFTGLPPISRVKIVSHKSSIWSVFTPVSTTVHPSPSSTSHRFMWSSPASGSGMRTQRMPLPTSMASPGSGRRSKG